MNKMNCHKNVQNFRDGVLDAIILMLDDAADMQGNILSTRPDLPNKLVSGTKEFKPRPVKATGADPTPEDLVETPEIQITPRIQELADNLNNDPVEIFTWVRNNIDYEPYYGSLKGSNETLIDMAGNDCDQSSLLITLLRASNIPARYVRGDVELKIEDLMNWTGGKTPEAAVKIIQSNYIPTQVIYKQEAIEGVIFDHIWVEIFDGHNWRLADPSYKEYVYTEGTEITSEQKDAITNLMEGATSVSDDGKRFSTNQEILNYAIEEASRILEWNVISKREILVNEKNNLPPYLARGIIGDRKPAEEFREMPDDMRHKVRVTFPDCEEQIFLMVDIATQMLSVNYKMVENGCFIADIDTIFDVLPMFTNMKPQLKINNTVVAEGNNVRLGSYHNLNLALFRPGMTEWESYDKPLIAGCSADIRTTTQKTSVKYIQELIEALDAVRENSGLAPDEQMTQEMVNETLRINGLMYFALMNNTTDVVSAQMGIVNVNHTSIAFTVDEIIPIGFFGLVFQITKGGAHIDVVRAANNPVSCINNADDVISWMQFVGGIGTNMEHTMFEVMYGIEAVSTAKIFVEANKAGIPIHAIKPETLETDLAQISASNAVKDHIRMYLTDETREFEAVIPQRGVTIENWSGQGWIILEPSTGCTGHMICGNLHNDTILNGGVLPTMLLNAMMQLHNWLSTAEGIAQALVIGGSAAIAAGTHAYAAWTLVAFGGASAACAAAYFAVVAMAIAYATIMLYIYLIQFALHNARYFIPRRKLVYVV